MCSAPGGGCPGLPALRYGFFPAVGVLEESEGGGGAFDVEGLALDAGIVGARGDEFVSQVLGQAHYSRQLAPPLVVYPLSRGFGQ